MNGVVYMNAYSAVSRLANCHGGHTNLDTPTEALRAAGAASIDMRRAPTGIEFAGTGAAGAGAAATASFIDIVAIEPMPGPIDMRGVGPTLIRREPLAGPPPTSCPSPARTFIVLVVTGPNVTRRFDMLSCCYSFSSAR